MRLTSIHIQNFRSIEELTFHLPDFTSLIGPNNSGKSSVLRAMDIFLNQKNPEPDEFRKSHQNGLPNETMIIEGCFEEIQEWERDTSGIAGIIRNNQIQLRLVATHKIEDNAITTKYEAYIRDEVISGWGESWGELSQQLQEIARGINIDGRAWKGKANQERVRQVIRESHAELITPGEEGWTSDNISIAPALKQAIPQAVLVPAVRDATDDAKPQAKTPFGILLSKIILPAIQGSDEYQALLQAVNALTSRISGLGGDQLDAVKALANSLSERITSIIETKVIVTLEPPDTDKFLGSNAAIHLDDGTQTPIYLQGHGAQRALIFAFIEVLAKENSVITREEKMNQRSTLLLFEEPELYMHPHIMRRLKTSLQSIAQNENWQVIISTHSPFLIDVANDPRSLIIFRRESPKHPPSIKQLNEDPFEEDEPSQRDREALRAALNFHPTVSEAFFAQQVVLVEGDTEIAVLRHEPNLLSLAGIDKGKSECTTVVSCGGKWTIPPIAKLLAKFEIPFRIIHDLDRKGKSEDQLKDLYPIHPYKANARIKEVANGAEIFVIEDTFENIIWDDDIVPTSDKPFRAWQRVYELCDGAENLDHAPKLRDFVLFALDWDCKK